MLTYRKMIRPLILLVLLFSGNSLLAQQNATDTIPATIPKYWKTGGSLGLNFQQVSLSNWAGGGQSSISIGSLVNLTADYSKGKSIWENRLDLAYGLNRQGDTNQTGFRKTDDLLNLISKYNYHLNDGFYISAIADYRTQMGIGYEYGDNDTRQRKSEFMAPGFLLTSLGATYKKGDTFSLTASPFTGKFTFVLDDSLSNAGAFGVDPGQRIRSELGALIRMVFQRDLITNVNLRTSLNLFGNYHTFSHIDVNWEGILLMKINKYLNTTVSAQLVYDHDVIQKTQWRNAINIGFLLEI